ncbi:hypothetical protein ACIBLA_27250 [Streptomyces sp. NPDC050433]|uniref:hypothetical protein n=1 Tax=Streptomyces sp. NPDC050433 TaxID=3365615 RepID=UPI003788A503
MRCSGPGASASEGRRSAARSDDLTGDVVDQDVTAAVERQLADVPGGRGRDPVETDLAFVRGIGTGPVLDGLAAPVAPVRAAGRDSGR